MPHSGNYHLRVQLQFMYVCAMEGGGFRTVRTTGRADEVVAWSSKGS